LEIGSISKARSHALPLTGPIASSDGARRLRRFAAVAERFEKEAIGLGIEQHSVVPFQNFVSSVAKCRDGEIG